MNKKKRRTGQFMRHAVLCSFFVMLAVLLPIASAIPNTPYVVVLGASAPASDAGEGANFAASMKAATGVTFTSQLDITTKESPDKLYVWIDGRAKTVTITGKEDALVEENTQVYFAKNGWKVIDGRGQKTKEEETYENKPESEEERDDGAAREEQDDNTTVTASRSTPVSEKPLEEKVASDNVVPEEHKSTPAGQDEEAAGSVPAPVKEHPGLFRRAWQWFVDIFS